MFACQSVCVSDESKIIGLCYLTVIGHAFYADMWKNKKKSFVNFSRRDWNQIETFNWISGEFLGMFSQTNCLETRFESS